jgi:adenosine deaminase
MNTKIHEEPFVGRNKIYRKIGKHRTVSYRPDPCMAAFIQALPKTETHLHIEGALPLELLKKVAPEKFCSPPPWWADEYRYEDFSTFEKALLDHASLWFTSPERYHEAARITFAGLAQQNVRYVETSFHLRLTRFIGA